MHSPTVSPVNVISACELTRLARSPTKIGARALEQKPHPGTPRKALFAHFLRPDQLPGFDQWVEITVALRFECEDFEEVSNGTVRNELENQRARIPEETVVDKWGSSKAGTHLQWVSVPEMPDDPYVSDNQINPHQYRCRSEATQAIRSRVQPDSFMRTDGSCMQRGGRGRVVSAPMAF